MERLTSLGLNQLEAEVYTLLLSSEPMTGYRIGQLLRKPTANVYKAIESLAEKGAVMTVQGENRLCRPVPAAEFLQQLENDFLEKTKRAAASLADLKPAIQDEDIYQLHSIPLILQRAEQMLGRAQAIAVVDAFPSPLEAIRKGVEAALARGVEVYVQAYAPVDIEGAQVALAHQSPQILEHWASQQLNLVIDGKELLVALLNQEMTEIYQAVWSESLYLSCMLHAGFMREHTIHRLMSAMETGNGQPEMEKILRQQKFFYNSNVPGQKELFTRFARREGKGA